jgi:ribA/ribD-fused uncharacterized protein
MSEKFTFFWGDGEGTEFSNWYPFHSGNVPLDSVLFECDGLKFNCAEQYMMFQKAMLFGDEETAEKIMQPIDPHSQKRLGREVVNFDAVIWHKVARQMVTPGIMAKFTQNKHLYEVLMATRGTTLVEASPYDRIWGIGLRRDQPGAQRRETWLGTNWLGEVLTEYVRRPLENSRGFYDQ